eukprot:1132744-Pelagomonas_calceolata.AAC.7
MQGGGGYGMYMPVQEGQCSGPILPVHSELHLHGRDRSTGKMVSCCHTEGAGYMLSTRYERGCWHGGQSTATGANVNGTRDPGKPWVSDVKETEKMVGACSPAPYCTRGGMLIRAGPDSGIKAQVHSWEHINKSSWWPGNAVTLFCRTPSIHKSWGPPTRRYRECQQIDACLSQHPAWEHDTKFLFSYLADMASTHVRHPACKQHDPESYLAQVRPPGCVQTAYAAEVLLGARFGGQTAWPGPTAHAPGRG